MFEDPPSNVPMGPACQTSTQGLQPCLKPRNLSWVPRLTLALLSLRSVHFGFYLHQDNLSAMMMVICDDDDDDANDVKTV